MNTGWGNLREGATWRKPMRRQENNTKIDQEVEWGHDLD